MIVHNSEPSRRHQGARPSRKWRVEPLPKEVCAGAGRESFPRAGEIGAGITLTQPPLVDRAERSGNRARRGVGEAAVGPCGRPCDRSSAAGVSVCLCVWDGEGAGAAGGGAHRESTRRREAAVREETVGRVGRRERCWILREYRERRAQLFPHALQSAQVRENHGGSTLTLSLQETERATGAIVVTPGIVFTVGLLFYLSRRHKQWSPNQTSNLAFPIGKQKYNWRLYNTVLCCLEWGMLSHSLG